MLAARYFDLFDPANHLISRATQFSTFSNSKNRTNDSNPSNCADADGELLEVAVGATKLGDGGPNFDVCLVFAAFLALS